MNRDPDLFLISQKRLRNADKQQDRFDSEPVTRYLVNLQLWCTVTETVLSQKYPRFWIPEDCGF